jgi:hypothetical protein
MIIATTTSITMKLKVKGINGNVSKSPKHVNN